MKCDELKEVENAIKWGLHYYNKSEVDEAIAELKQKLAEEREFGLNRAKSADHEIGKLCAELCVLKAKLENVQASAYAESVDAGMRERRLRSALWLARAWFCGRSSEYFSYLASRCKIGQEDFYREVSTRARRYMKSSYKCQAKAEEYK